MKPLLEKLPVLEDASCGMLDRRLDDGIPFEWHHHPEFELTLTLNSRGQRFIGDHLDTYEDGDLVLVGSNLPHTWSSAEKLDVNAPHVALVLWFHPDWLERLADVLPEVRDIRALFARAATGLAFSPSAAVKTRPVFETLFSLAPLERLTAMLHLLAMLSRDGAAVPLASPTFVPVSGMGDRSRIDRVLDHIHGNYRRAVTTTELAAIAALSPSGLNRLFRRHTQTTVSDYVIRLRIGKACSLLSSTRRPISHIAYDVGYESFANFNRQFKALRGVTPRAYRRQFLAERAG